MLEFPNCKLAMLLSNGGILNASFEPKAWELTQKEKTLVSEQLWVRWFNYYSHIITILSNKRKTRRIGSQWPKVEEQWNKLTIKNE